MFCVRCLCGCWEVVGGGGLVLISYCTWSMLIILINCDNAPAEHNNENNIRYTQENNWYLVVIIDDVCVWGRGSGSKVWSLV